ncbi:Exopolyphosphatase [hydrothermal vent metagenome]|uniref:Exopolyphosphatase n=1 Tax=hydrothermal vent metagenome TaxID=652676 RepID=A0A1W1EBX7_9ZZZZ
MISIDLGSNTLRVTKLDCQSGKFIADFEKIVKTADMLRRTGVIHHEAVDRVIYAIKEAQKEIDFSNNEVKAVTTEALRSASNSSDVLERIKKETGVAFEIISGDEEARLTLLAVKNRLAKLQYVSKSFVLVDIGGGSTELIFNFEDKVISKSFPIGIVTISQKYKNLEDIQSALSLEMLDMQKFSSQVYAEEGKVNSFIATAGTPTTVAAMKLGQNYACYSASKVNGTSVFKNELDIYLKKLLSLPFEERELKVGVGRSDLIAAGILIYKHVFSILEFESCIVIDDGLREGLALDGCLN